MHFSAGLPGADVPVGLPWHALALARLCLSCDLAPCPRPRFLLPGLPRGGRALRRWKNPVRGAAWGPGVLGERRSVGLGGASAPQGAPPPSGEGAEGKTRLGPTVGTCPRLVSAGAWPWVPRPPPGHGEARTCLWWRNRVGRGRRGAHRGERKRGAAALVRPEAGPGSCSWSRHRGLSKLRGPGAQRAPSHGCGGDEPFRRPALGQGLQEAGLASGWGGSDFNELTQKEESLGRL